MSKVFDYKGYQGSIEFNLNDGILFGKILFINDLVTFEAQTITELEREFHDSVDDYVDTCSRLGIEAKKPYSGTFNVRLGPDLHQKAAQAAIRGGCKLNEFVRLSVKDKVEKNNEVHLHHHHHHHKHTVNYNQQVSTDLTFGGYELEGFSVSKGEIREIKTH